MSTLHVQSNILCIQSFKNFFQTLPLILCTFIRFFNCNRLSMTVYIPVMHCLQCRTLLVYFQLQDVCDVVSKGLDSTTLTFTKTTSCVSNTILGALAMILVRVKITQNSLRLLKVKIIFKGMLDIIYAVDRNFRQDYIPVCLTEQKPRKISQFFFWGGGPKAPI